MAVVAAAVLDDDDDDDAAAEEVGCTSAVCADDATGFAATEEASVVVPATEDMGVTGTEADASPLLLVVLPLFEGVDSIAVASVIEAEEALLDSAGVETAAAAAAEMAAAAVEEDEEDAWGGF